MIEQTASAFEAFNSSLGYFFSKHPTTHDLTLPDYIIIVLLIWMVLILIYTFYVVVKQFNDLLLQIAICGGLVVLILPHSSYFANSFLADMIFGTINLLSNVWSILRGPIGSIVFSFWK